MTDAIWCMSCRACALAVRSIAEDTMSSRYASTVVWCTFTTWSTYTHTLYQTCWQLYQNLAFSHKHINYNHQPLHTGKANHRLFMGMPLGIENNHSRIKECSHCWVKGINKYGGLHSSDIFQDTNRKALLKSSKWKRKGLTTSGTTPNLYQTCLQHLGTSCCSTENERLHCCSHQPNNFGSCRIFPTPKMGQDTYPKNCLLPRWNPSTYLTWFLGTT